MPRIQISRKHSRADRTRCHRRRTDRRRPAGADRAPDRLRQDAPSAPWLPGRHKDAEHRVEECQSPVYLFVELADNHVTLYADAPIEAPTVRGFVSILVDGLAGATVEEVLAVPNDLIDRIGLPEILGMMRVRGLTGVLRRVKGEVAQFGRFADESINGLSRTERMVEGCRIS